MLEAKPINRLAFILSAGSVHAYYAYLLNSQKTRQKLSILSNPFIMLFIFKGAKLINVKFSAII
ncbi:hypothetical protein AZH43_05785 [Acinetobacter pragensis]|uniref:Uncharacterized protein n=1 Tax=Acinetobacter pragensis TaxID=1806892 RepID=A0A151Y5U0_9GAMM|nr:hypothetical protein AZH43_05785 [Acinetobacter pragensis]